jgi:hypothetical protein
MTKIRAGSVQDLIIMNFRNFYPFVSYLKIKILQYTELQFYVLFCMDVNLVSHPPGEEHKLRVSEQGAEESIWT